MSLNDSNVESSQLQEHIQHLQQTLSQSEHDRRVSQAVSLIIRQTIEKRVSHVKSGRYKGMNELLCSILSQVLSDETKVV